MKSNTQILNNSLYLLSRENNGALLWTGKSDNENQKSLLFLNPKDIVICKSLDEVTKSLERIQDYINKGFFAVGYLAYEAGFAFEENLKNLRPAKGMLIWFGIYQKPLILGLRILRLKQKCPDIYSKKFELKPEGFGTTKADYQKAVNKIKSCIAQGETYQVNYTINKNFKFSGDPYALFMKLCANQQVPYAAFIKNDFEYILSLSPELFFRRKINKITVRPMKGTSPRGRDASDDCSKALTLRDCLKERAENIMIVDLLRNDLGRICDTGSVRTKGLFDVTRLRTLWQMTSTIDAKLKKSITWPEIFKNIFPSGSVTGAPKIKTMQIINDLEKGARGVYTGAIGYISPEKSGVFNVGIRTLRIDKITKKAELGIGSGIVWDSKAEKEWEECLLKGDFLENLGKDFQLIETMVVKNKKIELLDYHLERLEESAYYFDFKFSRKNILRQILGYLEKLNTKFTYKLRFLLFSDGSISLEKQLLAPDKKCSVSRITFSNIATDSEDTFLYHKTTQREVYNSEHESARKNGFFDCIFRNERNEVTEGAISNIFIQRSGRLYTPGLSSGLLNGVYRRFLLANLKPTPVECVLYPDDIYKANKIFLTNAVSGIISVQPVRD